MGDAVQNPIVSVVTPSLNQGCFIRATIESVLSQNYPNIEYIIRDGGSTDETASVVKDYASRLTFIAEKDTGQSDAINKGFRMARGNLLSWLNSDDVYLPGAIRTAVEGFQRNPAAGALYGEGYQMDRDGKITSRFPHTEPPNLWKLVYLSDYILQQTLFFRKAALDDVGYLGEDLHYTMDWDLLIRIAMKYPLEYVPEYLGCLREYPEAKSFSGGLKRIREIRAMLQRHTGMRFPPGYVVYGLDTYSSMWCKRVDRVLGPGMRRLSDKVQLLIRTAAGLAIGRTVYHSQGWYSDGCAAPVLHYLLPPGGGRLVIEGYVPGQPGYLRQQIRVEANGLRLGQFALPGGEDFELEMDAPESFQGQTLRLTLKSLQWAIPARFRLFGDRRQIALVCRTIAWRPQSGTPRSTAGSVPIAARAPVARP